MEGIHGWIFKFWLVNYKGKCFFVECLSSARQLGSAKEVRREQRLAPNLRSVQCCPLPGKHILEIFLALGLFPRGYDMEDRKKKRVYCSGEYSQ